jgi:predicted transcriptional regulator
VEHGEVVPGTLFVDNGAQTQTFPDGGITPFKANKLTTLELAADIVSAFVSNNSVPAAELPALLGNVHAALNAVANGSAQQAVEEPKAPAVPIKKSVQPDHIVCLEDGKRFKSLKRHLRTTYDMTPEQYRAKWGLPASYPMVAPNYAATRSERRAGELRDCQGSTAVFERLLGWIV